MINASAGGVMYSSNPLDIRDSSIIINSVWGLPKAVVDGSVDPDVFVISKDPPMHVREKRIKEKELQYVCYPDEGLCRMDLTGDKRLTQSLTDEQALELARMAMKLEEYYGSPQDIEWAVTSDGSMLLPAMSATQTVPNGSRSRGDSTQPGGRCPGTGDRRRNRVLGCGMRACVHREERR